MSNSQRFVWPRSLVAPTSRLLHSLMLAGLCVTSGASAQMTIIDGPSGRISNVTTTATLVPNACAVSTPNALIDGDWSGNCTTPPSLNITIVEFNNPPPTVSFTFTFNQPYNISGFRIWNDRGALDSGIANFQLQFFDSNSNPIGVPYVNTTAPPQGSNPIPEVFRFADYLGAASATLTVVTSLGTTIVQVREIEFEAACTGTLIDYESLEHAGSGNAFANGFEHIEDAFHTATDATNTFRVFGTNSGSYAGSTALNGDYTFPISYLINHSFTLPPQFAGAGGGAIDTLFVPYSVGITELDASTAPGTSVTLTGLLDDDTTQGDLFVLDGDFATTTTFLFSQFAAGTRYLLWTSDQQIDNICILAACEDGIDNDGDSLIDLSDPDCALPGDRDERGIAPPSVLPLLSTDSIFVLIGLLVLTTTWAVRQPKS